MTYRLKIRPKAYQDIAIIAAWYEEQKQGLGNDFMLCLDAAIGGIQRNPLIFGKYYLEYRRAFVRRFPVGVFYILKDDLVSVVSVRDLRQDPNSITEQLS